MIPFPRIDAHTHLPADVDAARDAFDRARVKVVNICVDSHELGGLEAQRGWYRELRCRHPERFAWVTSFSLDGFGTGGWTDRAIAQLADDFEAGGAVGCKVWKNVGMELRDPATGAFVFVDDERFGPIFEWLAARGRPLLMHIAEPMACWAPLDPASPHYGYYSTQPQWHWHGRRDVPTHARLIASRDAVTERYPDLVVAGAHYGSLESDLNEVAARFERFGNFFVDTSSRLADIGLLTARDRDGVRAFFIRHADRIIWGTDPVQGRPMSQLSAQELETRLQWLTRMWMKEWRFFATDEQLMFNNVPARGLALPDDVLQKMFVWNAQRVYRGV
jgi:predicted TIM-barrel fold metal-dependent hydrolase